MSSHDVGGVLAQYPRVDGDRATVTFVLCIEANASCGQALLLCESIRACAGMYRDAPIVAVTPRPGLAIDAAARRALESLLVDHHEVPLESRCPEYAPAGRTFAGAWAESWVPSDWVILLDSDTVFLDEPYMPTDGDAGVRPPDGRGCATTGPGDPCHAYWERLASLGGTAVERLPLVESTIDRTRVHACYGGGLVVARRSCGILTAAAQLLTSAVDAGLKPQAGTRTNVFASTGYIGAAASEYWGASQAATSVAIWSRTSRVHVFPDAFGVPLHAVAQQSSIDPRWTAAPPVHVHYRWMFTPSHASAAVDTLRRLGARRERIDWLASRLPLGV